MTNQVPRSPRIGRSVLELGVEPGLSDFNAHAISTKTFIHSFNKHSFLK